MNDVSRSNRACMKVQTIGEIFGFPHLASSFSSNYFQRKWEPTDPSIFNLRCGPNYRRNGYKKPSDGYLMIRE